MSRRHRKGSRYTPPRSRTVSMTFVDVDGTEHDLDPADFGDLLDLMRSNCSICNGDDGHRHG